MQIDFEEWRDIAGYEGLYQISNIGRVKSLTRNVECPIIKNKTIKERIRKSSATPTGHRNVVLSKNGVNKHKLVHRLVAAAFIDNPENLPVVNHKDENPANNHVDNLEWCTCQYNNTYGKHAERIKNTDFAAMQSKAKRTTKEVNQYTLDNVLVKTWESLTVASKETKTNLSRISDCCRGKRTHSNGFMWKFAEVK